MLSSDWLDVIDLVRSRDLLAAHADTYDNNDNNDNNDDFLEIIDSLADKASISAAVRWAVGVGADARLVIQLQALTGTADSLLHFRVRDKGGNE
jgi:hypothetical protein